MPRDINGVYTLPAPMPVQPRTIPVTNVFNTVLADVKDALNNIPGDALAPGSVDTAQLADNSVTNAKMADNAINTAELVDGAVTEPKLATDAVTTDKIVDEAVTESKLGGLLTNSIASALRIGIDRVAATAIELGGQAGVATTSHIDFHSGAVTTDFDSRIFATGGSGANGQGTLAVSAADFFISQGRLRFPATANLSSDPNTLDDYEEGTWTPTFTCINPGNLSVTYVTRAGAYMKIGQKVYVQCDLSISAMTHSTASGTILISGLPFVCPGEQPFPCAYWNQRPSGIVPMLRRAGSTVPNYQTVLRIADLSTGNMAEVQITAVTSPLPSNMWLFLSGWYDTNV